MTSKYLSWTYANNTDGDLHTILASPSTTFKKMFGTFIPGTTSLAD